MVAGDPPSGHLLHLQLADPPETSASFASRPSIEPTNARVAGEDNAATDPAGGVNF